MKLGRWLFPTFASFSTSPLSSSSSPSIPNKIKSTNFPSISHSLNPSKTHSLPYRTNSPTPSSTSPSSPLNLQYHEIFPRSSEDPSSDSGDLDQDYLQWLYAMAIASTEDDDSPLGLQSKRWSDDVEQRKERDLEERWSGWDTTTIFMTVTQQPDNQPGTVTVTTVLNQPPPTGTGTVTEYTTIFLNGAPNQQTVTLTETFSNLCPQFAQNGIPCTFTQTQTISLPKSVTTVTTVIIPNPTQGGSQPDNTPSEKLVCNPGDQDATAGSGLHPTHTQTVTLYAMATMWVGILVGWNLFLIRHAIYPLKLLTVAFHEFGHVLVCALSGARIDSVGIDPNEGGLTLIQGGRWPVVALPAGYMMSFIFGGIFIFCGFDTLASKVASGVILLGLIVVFWWAAGIITKLLTVATIGLLIALWFIDHASGLRYFVLFVGIMNAFYIIYDVMDDFVFRKVNVCCPQQHAMRIPRINPGTWALIYFVLSWLFFIAFLLAALATWKQTPHAMYCQSQTFLPT